MHHYLYVMRHCYIKSGRSVVDELRSEIEKFWTTQFLAENFSSLCSRVCHMRFLRNMTFNNLTRLATACNISFNFRDHKSSYRTNYLRGFLCWRLNRPNHPTIPAHRKVIWQHMVREMRQKQKITVTSASLGYRGKFGNISRRSMELYCKKHNYGCGTIKIEAINDSIIPAWKVRLIINLMTTERQHYKPNSNCCDSRSKINNN